MMAMLKLLLVGFTEQNANVIQMFIELTFENVKVSRIPRLPENTQPRMPELTVLEAESDILVIDAESIGFDFANYQTACQHLTTVMPNKAILLISRQQIPTSIEENSPVNFQWLSVPYSRKQMADKLQLLISEAQLKKTPMSNGSQNTLDNNLSTNSLNAQPASTSTPDNFDLTSGIDTTNPAQHLNTSSTTNATSRPTLDTASSDAILTLLATTFKGLNELPYFEFVQTLYQLPTYTVFQISGHHLYINPFEKTVVASRIERILDHFMIGQNLRQCIATRQSLDEASFEQQTQRHLASGDKKLTISKLIWYIGIEMVPRSAFDDSHHLAIEARFMPNLSGINFVPNYVLPMISSCIGRVRNLQEFHQLFPQLTNAQVNQVIILLALSHGLNNEVLLNSRPAMMLGNHSLNNHVVKGSQPPVASADTTAVNQLPKPPTTPDNAGLKKAQQTGFLKRLLGKLGVNV